jgi:ABC-2 type transport system permease protein
VPVFLLLFIAPVWVPLDLLTGWVEAVATVNPLTLLLDADRSLIAGRPDKVGLAFAVIAGITAALVLWARGGLRSAERAAG